MVVTVAVAEPFSVMLVLDQSAVKAALCACASSAVDAATANTRANSAGIRIVRPAAAARPFGNGRSGVERVTAGGSRAARKGFRPSRYRSKADASFAPNTLPKLPRTVFDAT